VSKTVAIVQSSYIPWKGYFDLINFADEFILYDDRQYTRRDWRNRNRIKTRQGVRWLTVPVEVKGRYHQRIDETNVSDPAWAQTHWRKLVQSYAGAPFFDLYRDRLEPMYLDLDERSLSRINRRFLEAICALLGIETKLSWSTDYEAQGAKTERLVDLCRAAGATEYLTGPSARTYLEVDLLAAAGVSVRWMDYDGYPEYPQLYPPFEHAVTVLDLLVHTGPDAPRYMKSFA
jgi:hypothetical protein